MQNQAQASIAALSDQFVASIRKLALKTIADQIKSFGETELKVPRKSSVAQVKAAVAAPAVPAAKVAKKKVAKAEITVGDLAQLIIAFVKANPGTRSEPIKAALKVNSKHLGEELKKLVTAGRIKRAGKARGSVYTAS